MFKNAFFFWLQNNIYSLEKAKEVTEEHKNKIKISH